MSSTTTTAQMASLAVLTALVCAALAASGAAGVRVELTRVHSGATASQFVRDALRRDMHRHNARQLAAATVTAPTRKNSPGGGEYLMTLAIGTPPLSYPAIADTGSDLIWTQCAPCLLCVDQPTPYFDAKRSATYRALPCRSPRCGQLYYPACFQKVCVYQYYYGDTAGVLANETLLAPG